MQSAKILVVDDDPDFVEIMRTILESHGYTVVTAANESREQQFAGTGFRHRRGRKSTWHLL